MSKESSPFNPVSNNLGRRKFLKKSALIIAGTTFSASFLAACGDATLTSAPAATTVASTTAAATTAAAISPTAVGAITTAAPGSLAAKTIQFLSVQTEETGYTKILGLLTREYQKTQPNLKYEVEAFTTGDLNQKIQLMVSQNALPTVYAAPAIGTFSQMVKNGQALDIEQTFRDLGIYDRLVPAAVNLVKTIQGGTGMHQLPTELNIEGFWYNKKIFADNGLKEPATWDELISAAATLKSKNIQPFSASGDQKWPITRLIGSYAVRKYGIDALDRVAKGELKVTDAGFIEAAQAVKELGTNGYFGPGVTTIDYDTAVDTFLQGKAAMFYMGSWQLRDNNDPKRNKIGADNIGFFNFPAVKGGKSTTDDWLMNAGQMIAINKNQYDAGLQDWLKVVFSQYGDRSMAELGAITGFQVTKAPDNLAPLTKMVQQKIATVKNSYLWWEARLTAKQSSVATDNVQNLVTSATYTAQQYMSELQKALDDKSS